MNKDGATDFDDIKATLSQQMTQERREASLGKGKKRVNTSAENSELGNLDATDTRVALPSNIS